MEMNPSSIIVLVLVVLAVAGILLLRRAGTRSQGDGQENPSVAKRVQK